MLKITNSNVEVSLMPQFKWGRKVNIKVFLQRVSCQQSCWQHLPAVNACPRQRWILHKNRQSDTEIGTVLSAIETSSSDSVLCQSGPAGRLSRDSSGWGIDLLAATHLQQVYPSMRFMGDVLPSGSAGSSRSVNSPTAGRKSGDLRGCAARGFDMMRASTDTFVNKVVCWVLN